ncbi:MAG: serine/threonine protein kinase, partial [bacterium]|nr:serine/threonine protein kinase [bacterium]
MEPFPDIPGYTIEKRLGKGRLTNVYQAEKTDTGQMVVIKVLLPELIEAENDKFAKRFLYEARNASKLDHLNIGKILDVAESGGHYYFTRPYYPQSLRERIVNKNLSVDMEETGFHDLLDILRQLFDALDYAQQEEAVHRDIRPENIHFTEDGTPLFTDFYMSELVKASESLKEKGITVSTPQYTSPEQVLRKTVDTGSDIYSLGVTIYEMLTNNVPYDGDVALAIENQHIMEPIPRLPGALSLFQPLIERMMAKAKEDRAQSGAELILLLEELSEKFSEASMETEMGEEVELELGQELKKELEMEKGLDLDLDLSPEPEKKPMLQDEEPSGKWETLKTQATQAADGAGG